MIKDLHATEHRFSAVGCGGSTTSEVPVGGTDQIWLGGGTHGDDLLADVDDGLFYGGDFPPLPDFPCMSSSSSSTSTPAKPVGTTASSASTSSASSSSPAASWAVRSSADRTVVADAGTTTLSSTASMEIVSEPHDRSHDHHNNCMDDVMEGFDYVDQLIESSNDFFDPCSLFQQDYPPEDFQVPDLKLGENQDDDDQNQFREDFGSGGGQFLENSIINDQSFMMIPTHNDNDNIIDDHHNNNKLDDSVDDLGSVFLEWLKNNKETVCAEDLRRVKIKKATIECAAKRLGGGREAMKQLLKLILEWVQSNHLHRRRSSGIGVDPAPTYQDPPPAPFQNPSLDPSTYAWSFPEPPPSYDQVVAAAGPPVYVGVDPSYCSNNNSSGGAVVVAPPLQHPGGYPAVAGAEYVSNNNNSHNHNNQMLDSAQTWPASHFGFQAPAACYNNNNQSFNPNPMIVPGFGNQQYNGQYQYFQGNNNNNNNNGDKLVRVGSSATKEARKKRMARQRRFFAHRGHNFQQNQGGEQLHARPGGENCASNPGGWMFHWPSGPIGPNGLPVDGQKATGSQLKQNSANDRRQGWKPEKNLRFLLQKVLKQSDVGNLGRIVLPKKEAETHLPELEARDGIAISMEDIGTSRVWNMRYRFWPNNKSRMYLLENTGDFVRTNGLQEGDFIVIYSDVKCGKYLIRGVKVRQPGAKIETKRPTKVPRNQQCASPAGTAPSSSPVTQTTK